MSRYLSWQVIMVIGIAALIVTGMPGCGGGGGGGGGEDEDTGEVAGVVQYWDQAPLENIMVTVAEISARSDRNGNFLITGVPPGENQELTVTTPDWLALPPTGEPIRVNVYANRTTTLDDAIVLFDADILELPDPPWED